MKIAVGIASTGRPQVLDETIRVLARQSRLPDQLWICPAKPEDYEPVTGLSSFPINVVTGAVGSCAQRNLILSALAGIDIVVFLDDDFFPADDYLEQIEILFTDSPDIVAATGRPIEDGASGPGLTVEHGLSVLAKATAARSDGGHIAETTGTYGCNMAFRVQPIREQNLFFDENLPLYGWQEDIDFSSRLAPCGRIVEANSLRGVHLGFKAGRTSGLRFGYSQIANPVYLVGKGTMPRRFARNLMLRNFVANLLGSLSPEPWIDRRGRLRGNFLALRDILTKRMSPRRILELR